MVMPGGTRTVLGGLMSDLGITRLAGLSPTMAAGRRSGCRSTRAATSALRKRPEGVFPVPGVLW
jgi:hypothetical protein